MSTEKSFKGSLNSRTSEVLVTFSAKWIESLLSGAIKCVLRRRYPKYIVPTRMYIYVAAPFSQIIGVSSINKIIDVGLTQAKELKECTHVGENDLIQYFNGYKTVGCYFIEKPQIFHPAIHLEALRENWSFYPPQSFVSLSREAVEWLDTYAAANTRLVRTRGDASISAGKKR